PHETPSKGARLHTHDSTIVELVVAIAVHTSTTVGIPDVNPVGLNCLAGVEIFHSLAGRQRAPHPIIPRHTDHSAIVLCAISVDVDRPSAPGIAPVERRKQGRS